MGRPALARPCLTAFRSSHRLPWFLHDGGHAEPADGLAAHLVAHAIGEVGLGGVAQLRMPEMDGVEFVQALPQRPLHRDTPIVVASSEREDSELGLAARTPQSPSRRRGESPNIPCDAASPRRNALYPGKLWVDFDPSSYLALSPRASRHAAGGRCRSAGGPRGPSASHRLVA